MSRMISVSINVSKLDKEKIVKGKDGAKYVDLILFETPGGEFGDFSVKQSSTAEERANKVRLPFLGNGKWIKPKNSEDQDTSSESGSDDFSD